MKNLFLKLAVVAITLGAVESCKKDETQVVLSNNATPQLTASATTATITRNNASPAVAYTWAAADFNYQAAVTYTLQFAKAGNNFAKTADYNMGNALSKSFSVTELNDVYNNVDCNLPDPDAKPAPMPPVPPIALEVRVKATVGDAVAPVLSGTRTITATPYPAVVIPTEKWGLVGPAGDGWPGATNTDRLLTYDCTIGAYTITTDLKPGAFLFRQDLQWNTKLGGPAGDFTKGIALSTSGSDLVWVKAAGTYKIVLKVNKSSAGGVSDGKLTITP